MFEDKMEKMHVLINIKNNSNRDNDDEKTNF